MREGRGGHFDPDILDAFLAYTDASQAIAERVADDDSAMRQAEAQHSRAVGERPPE